MSRTRQPEQLLKPASKYIKYNGGRDPEDPGKWEGKFTYYDKEAKEDVEVDLKKPFIILDGCTYGSNLISVTGWCEATKLYHWSNEVRSIDDQLVVRSFDKQKTIVLQGSYSDIKADVKALGLKYTRCIYLVFSGDPEIYHLSLNGGSFRKWVEAIENFGDKIKDHYVRFSGSEKGKKGTAKYWSPNFEFGDKISEEDSEMADKADERLQSYLDKYLKKSPVETPVYDRDNTDTDSWAFIEYKDKELKDYTIDELNTIREGLEGAGEEDGTLYQFVCRAVFELQKEKDSKKETKKEGTEETKTKEKEETKDKFNPFKKKNPLNKEKKEEEFDWKSVKLPDSMDEETLGELSEDDRKELKGYIEEDEDLKEEYKELHMAILYSLGENIPF